MGRVSSFHHTAILIGSSEDASRLAWHFYHELLGLEPDLARPESLAAAGFWFNLGPFQGALHLMKVADPQPPLGEGSTAAHVALAVDDLAHIRQRLEQEGTETWDRPGFPLPRFFARDPFGNVLEFIETTEGHTLMRSGAGPIE